MKTLAIVILVLLLFGGGGWGYYDREPRGLYGGLGLALLVIVLLYMAGVIH